MNNNNNNKNNSSSGINLNGNSNGINLNGSGTTTITLIPNNGIISPNGWSSSSWNTIYSQYPDSTIKQITEIYVWGKYYDVIINSGDFDFDFDSLFEINNMSCEDFLEKYNYAIKNNYDTWICNTMYNELYSIALRCIE